jgi:hypothetical protein
VVVTCRSGDSCWHDRKGESAAESGQEDGQGELHCKCCLYSILGNEEKSTVNRVRSLEKKEITASNALVETGVTGGDAIKIRGRTNRM